ncbi:MAG: hypothetical protein ACRD0Y_02630 [Terriglobales bacterium]
MRRMEAEQALQKITAWLVELYGARLQSLIAYGSAAGGNHRGKRSDTNLLAILDQLDATSLDLGVPAVQWWKQQGNPPLVMWTREEWADSADVFPIEFLDIAAHHRVLHGDDLFANLPHFPDLHRLQVEHDLRARVLRLRGAYMALGRDAKALEALMVDSISSFLTLFRHALAVVGEPLQVNKTQVLAAAAARFQFGAAPLAAVLEARLSGARLQGGKLESLRQLFADYLAVMMQVERSVEASKP